MAAVLRLSVTFSSVPDYRTESAQFERKDSLECKKSQQQCVKANQSIRYLIQSPLEFFATLLFWQINFRAVYYLLVEEVHTVVP